MSFVFSGAASNYLSVSSDLITSNNYTFFCYYKETGNASTWRYVFRFNNTASNYVGLRVRGNNNCLDLDMLQTGSAQAVTTTAVTQDVWHPIVIMSNGATSGRIKTASEDIGASPGAWVTNNAASLSIGADAAGANPIQGKVAHLAVWNRELSTGELDSLLAGTDPATITTGLVELWDGSSLTGTNGTVLAQTGTVTINDPDTPMAAPTGPTTDSVDTDDDVILGQQNVVIATSNVPASLDSWTAKMGTQGGTSIDLTPVSRAGDNFTVHIPTDISPLSHGQTYDVWIDYTESPS